jgi:cell wall-associated NlpC family hydrolase
MVDQANSGIQYTPSMLQSMAAQAGRGAGLTNEQLPVFMSLIGHESSWNPDAVSPVGAVGLGQLMPATAKSLGVTNINDPVQNLRGAATYFRQQLAAFGGNVSNALAAYNAGPAAVRKYGGIPPYQETQNYVTNVLQGSKGMNVPQAVATPGYQGFQQQQSPPALNAPTGAAPLAGPAAFQQLSRNPQGGGFGNVVSALRNLGGVSPFVIKALESAGKPMPTVEEQRGVQDQQQNFNFKFANPSSAISKSAAGAIALCRQYLGTPYVWGGESAKGFDCSGLLQFVWAKQGVDIPRTTYDQWNTGKTVPTGKLQPGDAVFFKGSDSIQRGGETLPGHVGMYIGHGEIIQAPHTGATVEVTPLKDMKDYMGARRFS